MKTLVLPQKAICSGTLILINAQLPIGESWGADALVPVRAGDKPVLLVREAARQLSGLMAKLDGWQSIAPVSGWRSRQEQQEIYAQSLHENGAAFTQTFVALPGHSEHQTGLAIDLGLTKPDIDFIRPDFPDFGVCRAFRRRAAAFGFVERYPAGKERITGIGHEPWHFRYVGTPHAAIMAERCLTLEEYHDFLKGYPHGKTPFAYRHGQSNSTISYVPAQVGDTCLQVEDGFAYTVSGNNADGFVVTARREQVR